jgi:hypothetical protein
LYSALNLLCDESMLSTTARQRQRRDARPLE